MSLLTGLGSRSSQLVQVIGTFIVVELADQAGFTRDSPHRASWEQSTPPA